MAREFSVAQEFRRIRRSPARIGSGRSNTRLSAYSRTNRRSRELPSLFSTPELNITVTDETKFKIIEDFSTRCNLKGEKITIDGLRINFDNGWGLLRASNTTPKLVMRFEGNTEDDLKTIQSNFIDELSRICPDIDINLD